MTTRYASGRREGITEDLVAALADYEAGPFSAREKTALRYADRMYVDHHQVDDALFADVRHRFAEDETLELTWVIAEFIALGKVIHVLQLPYGESAGATARTDRSAN